MVLCMFMQCHAIKFNKCPTFYGHIFFAVCSAAVVYHSRWSVIRFQAQSSLIILVDSTTTFYITTLYCIFTCSQLIDCTPDWNILKYTFSLNICKESYQVPMFLCQSVLCPQTTIILHFTKIKIKINDLYITRSWQSSTGKLKLSQLLLCIFKKKKINCFFKIRWHLFQSCTLQPGFVPFFRSKFPGLFQDWQIDFSRTLKFTLTPTLPRSQC